jgi:hypothetical protein
MWKIEKTCELPIDCSMLLLMKKSFCHQAFGFPLSALAQEGKEKS